MDVPIQQVKRAWWCNWEVYLIVLVAALFRLVFINNTQFMADHAIFYQMAYDGLKHGLWPISGNRSSAGPLISPLFVYVMMIPAAISPNPIGGAIFVALCNVAGVLLTYLFTNRYYGRLAGAIASLLYATAIYVIIFNRDIWQPDLLPPLTILFIWCLFKGVVEQRRNWFLPAVLLLGVMVQFHTTAIYLVVPLLAALVLAFRTLRLREIALTIGASLILFSPYILLERMVHFVDIQQNIKLVRSPA
ncbi:MAG: ArnT family glycosyltransferase, partial [Ktedonobacteraceae bacterium]